MDGWGYIGVTHIYALEVTPANGGKVYRTWFDTEHGRTAAAAMERGRGNVTRTWEEE